MNFRKAKKVETDLAIVGGVLLLVGIWWKSVNLIVIAFAVAVVGAVIGQIFFRCPDCKKHIKMEKKKIPEICPCCGRKL